MMETNCGAHLTLRTRAGIRAEVGWFVHIIPKTVNVHTSIGVEEVQELAIPVLLRVGMKPVGKHSWTRPHSTLVEGAIGSLLPHFHLGTVFVDIITTTPYSRVNHDNVMLLMLVKVVDQLADHFERVALWVQREEAPELHVVDIGPHSLPC
jgi:hypothetical protein